MTSWLESLHVPPWVIQWAEHWDSSVLFLTLLSLIVWLIWKVVHRRLVRLTEKTKLEWDNFLLNAIQAPMTLLIWGFPASISIGLLMTDVLGETQNWLSLAKQVLVIICIVWALVRFISEVEQHFLMNTDHDETTVLVVAKILRLMAMILGSLSIMQSLGLSLSGLLTFGGVGGLVVGLAAKDLLSNFFGGLMIYFERPFKVGDWIRSPDREIEGTVEHIGWRMTRIRTFDKRPLYVPNSVFATISVENPSRMTNRRIRETIGLRYDDVEKVAVILEEVKAMLVGHPEIDTNQTLMVNFNAFGASSLDFFIYTFTKTTNWAHYHEVKQDVLFQIVAIIHRHGADIAYPTQTLKIEASEPVELTSSSVSS